MHIADAEEWLDEEMDLYHKIRKLDDIKSKDKKIIFGVIIDDDTGERRILYGYSIRTISTYRFANLKHIAQVRSERL